MGGGIGRHCRLKICCPNGRGGSSPPLGTIVYIGCEFVALQIRYNSWLKNE